MSSGIASLHSSLGDSDTPFPQKKKRKKTETKVKANERTQDLRCTDYANHLLIIQMIVVMFYIHVFVKGFWCSVSQWKSE